MLNRITTVQVCDATEDDSSNADDNNNNLIVDIVKHIRDCGMCVSFHFRGLRVKVKPAPRKVQAFSILHRL